MRQAIRVSSNLFLLLLLSDCAHPKVYWSGKIYGGDSAHQRVVRAQSNESISCSDPQFSKGSWISDEDLQNLMDAIIDANK